VVSESLVPADAINVDTAEEATRHLEATATLGQSMQFARTRQGSQPSAIAEGVCGAPPSPTSDAMPAYPAANALCEIGCRAPKTYSSAASVPRISGPIAEGSEHMRGARVPGRLAPQPPSHAGSRGRHSSKSNKPNGVLSSTSGHTPLSSPLHSAHNVNPYNVLSPHSTEDFITDRSVSIDLYAASATLASSHRHAGMPTGSHTLDPGPYHRANSRLREMLPHYHVKVAVKLSYVHVILTVIAVIAFVMYMGTRLWYLVSGKTSTFDAQFTSVPYSWVVWVAELALGFLGFYGHQTYWKQTCKYTSMAEDELDALYEVRVLLVLECCWC
jgi:hypothetical protein